MTQGTARNNPASHIELVVDTTGTRSYLDMVRTHFGQLYDGLQEAAGVLEKGLTMYAKDEGLFPAGTGRMQARRVVRPMRTAADLQMAAAKELGVTYMRLATFLDPPKAKPSSSTQAFKNR